MMLSLVSINVFFCLIVLYWKYINTIQGISLTPLNDVETYGWVDISGTLVGIELTASSYLYQNTYH